MTMHDRTFALTITAADVMQPTAGGLTLKRKAYQRYTAEWKNAKGKSQKVWIGGGQEVQHGSYDGGRQRRKTVWTVKIDGDEVGTCDTLKEAKALAEQELGIIQAVATPEAVPGAAVDGAGAGVVDPVKALAPPKDGAPDPFALLRVAAGGKLYEAVEPISVGTTAGGTYSVGAGERVQVSGPDQAGFYSVTPQDPKAGGRTYKVMGRIFDRAFLPVGGGARSVAPTPQAPKKSPAGIRGAPMTGPGSSTSVGRGPAPRPTPAKTAPVARPAPLPVPQPKAPGGPSWWPFGKNRASVEGYVEVSAREARMLEVTAAQLFEEGP